MRYTVPALRQSAVELFVIWLEPGYKAPEAPGVVHMLSMTKLVDHQVASQLGFEKEQAEVQADGAGTAAAAPAGALCPHLQLVKRRAGEFRHRSEFRFELFLRDAGQPALQCLDAESLVRNLSCQRDYSIAGAESNGF